MSPFDSLMYRRLGIGMINARRELPFMGLEERNGIEISEEETEKLKTVADVSSAFDQNASGSIKPMLVGKIKSLDLECGSDLIEAEKGEVLSFTRESVRLLVFKDLKVGNHILYQEVEGEGNRNAINVSLTLVR